MDNAKIYTDKEVSDFISSLKNQDIFIPPCPGQIWKNEQEEAIVLLSIHLLVEDNFVPGVVFQVGKMLKAISLDSFVATYTKKKDVECETL